MKIAPLSETMLAAAKNRGTEVVQRSFDQVRSQALPPGGVSQILGSELSAEIAQVTKAVLSGKEIPAQQLIAFQIKAGQFGLRVELISKVAEAGISTLKRLQNPQ